MIHYHGSPITPMRAAFAVFHGRHAMVSFAHHEQIALIAEICQSFCIDNGAFSMWKSGIQPKWDMYFEWLKVWMFHPGCDFVLIPDIINGTEDENNRLIDDWTGFLRKIDAGDLLYSMGVPVWHLHESLDRLTALMRFPRIALGSSQQYAKVGTRLWWNRIHEAMSILCNHDGVPLRKIHGLRMLNPTIFSHLPLASADSTNIARNIGIDRHWKGNAYQPKTKMMRGLIIAERIEAHASAARWNGQVRGLEYNKELLG